MTVFPDHPFWRFSLEVYARPGVRDACLVLQDEWGADVNLLLYGAWIGASGRGVVGEAELRGLDERTAVWRGEVIRPLRALRRRLEAITAAPVDRAAETPDPAILDALRRQVGAAELDAEHAAQLLLAADASAPAPDADLERRVADAAANLRACLRQAGVPDAASTAHIGPILGGCFPEADSSAIARAAVPQA